MNKKFNVIGLFICLFCAIPIVAMDNQSQATKDFLQAVRDENFQQANLELRNGADINGKGNKGITALLEYSSSGNLKIVKYLVERGADKNAMDDLGRNSLHFAAGKGYLSIVKYLVEQGADINAVDKFKKTSLHSAALYGHLEIVKYLVEQGTDINAVDKHKKTPLHFAASYDYLDIVKYLVEQGADINVKNKHGETPLILAQNKNRDQVVDYLNSVTLSMRTYYHTRVLVKNNWGKVAIVSGLGLGLFAAGLRLWYARRTGGSFIPKITWFNRKALPQIQMLAPKVFAPVNLL